MITPDKTITDNAFVDNVLYYSKLIALNCTIKDEEEALSQETVESLRRRELLISSVEKTSTYEVYQSIPKEILEKYIAVRSNLDVYGESITALKTHMNSYGIHERNKILNKLSDLARSIYIGHYEIMMTYLDEIGDTWFADNEVLYNNCKNLTATYKDLFNILPNKTVYRIIETYINNYDNTDIEDLSSDLNKFQAYVNNRTDSAIETELIKINEAMRNVFISHYDIMIERGYVKESSTTWRKYFDEKDTYRLCENGRATYHELFGLFPKDSILDSLTFVFGADIVNQYDLSRSANVLDEYIKKHDPDGEIHSRILNKHMSDKYLANYNSFINHEVYISCLDKLIDFYELYEYLPLETRKIIINSQINEKTNLQVYSESKEMFNSYLNTLSKDEREQLKASITSDLQSWYPTHHEELNNYYRSIIGLPPLDSNGDVMVDTLIHSWDDNTKQFIEFNNKFISRAPDSIYPEIHWKQELYEFDSYDIGILNQYGIIDDWIAACKADINNPRYRYLKYLGDNALDIYTCSKAMNFQLIGLPTVDDADFRRKFIDTYAINRDYVIRTVYSDAYKFQSDYYNKFIIIFILINTIMDCLTSIPEYIINKEVFDSRCIKYLFESYGIPYYSEIPVKYQKAMLKNLNILIKYKSSTRNMVDICSLFGFSDVKVFNYYLFKQRLVDTNTGEYEFDEDNDISYNLNKLYVRDDTGVIKDYNGARYTKLLEYRDYDPEVYTKTITCEDDNGNIKQKTIINNDADVYILDEVANDFIPFKDVDYFTKIKAETSPAELKFIKVPVNEDLSEYKNDPDYIIPYDEIVYQDEGDTWDGGDDHDRLYNKLVDHEFNAVKTKYVSVETVTEMTELSFQVSYFYNMLFDNMYSEDALTVEIPYIKIGHKFRFMDVVCYLFSLMYLYNGLEDNIMYSPTQILYVKGYNFDTDLNEVIQDATAFQQNNPITEEPYKDYQKYNIFDINERIAEDGYDYREAFKYFDIKAFNLECDVDALEKWLNDNFQMSLDDFIVDDTLTNFTQVITLRSFFSLNNSYYQKNIFRNNLLPIAYNQDIKYGFDYELYNKIIKTDINENKHEYVTEDQYYMDILTNTSKSLYIMDYINYIRIGEYGHDYAVYYKYNKQQDGTYIRNSIVYYKNQDTEDEFKPLFVGDIGIIDKNNNCIFAADSYYTKNEDNTYTIISDKKHFRDIDESLKSEVNYSKILNFGQYYIYSDGKWILDPDNCYIKVVKNGEIIYVLASEADNYENIVVSEDKCYILHSDGHFIKLTETDYYRDQDKDNNYQYTEEDCYIVTDEATEYYDPSVNPIVYYKKLTDYYNENNYDIYSNIYYVKDSDGNYIPQSEIIDPNNCYYDNDGNMSLVINSLARYVKYDNSNNAKYVLILQDNYDYIKYINDGKKYIPVEDNYRRYVYNSDTEYITVIMKNAIYDNTKSIIVVLNKSLKDYEEIENEKYNPEKTDGVWDENDWFYRDGYYGEHDWYYKKPGEEIEDDEDESKAPVGSGFYFESKSYIGDIELEAGNKYYMAFDIETNFTGNIQIICDSDKSVENSQSRVYSVTQGEKQHIDQIFIANEITKPGLKFLIYNYNENPIDIGDFIIISNIRFIKAHSDNFIAQDIPSYDLLQELYRTNEAIYKYLTALMVETDNIHTYEIYKKIYDSLMISKYNKEAFKIGENTYAKTYTDFLETRDAVLYQKLSYFKSLDIDAMRKQIADDIVEVAYAIDDCIDTYSYGYLYSYFPAISASYIQQYIVKIINFFKSWKVHLLGINTVYKFDDPFENTVRALECHKYRNRIDNIKNNVYIYGSAKINPIDDVNPSGKKYTDIIPDLVQYSHTFYDSCTIRDRVRIISTTANKLDHFYDSDGELNLILNEETVEVNTEDGILKITSDNSSFKVINNNMLEMTTDENEQDVFGIQRIGEINSDSIDIIEWRDLEEDNQDE
jgi:hypothetical protein